MRLSARARQALLVSHIVTSVGWLGAVVVSVVLGVVASESRSLETARAACIVLEPVGWYVLVPLSVASLVTGTVQGLVSRWGVVQHYWVVAKLVINLVATSVLLLYMQTLSHLADEARRATTLSEVGSLSPVLHAVVAAILLTKATVLSVFKPRGLTRRGQRRRASASRSERPRSAAPPAAAG